MIGASFFDYLTLFVYPIKKICKEVFYMYTQQWSEQMTQEKLQGFQEFCQSVGIDPPKDMYDLAWFDSYKLCLTLRDYQLTFDEVNELSQCVRLDKYYVDKLIMFPSTYLCDNQERSYCDLNAQEKEVWDEQAHKCLQSVCENQRSFFQNDIAMSMLETHLSHAQQDRDDGRSR